MKAQPIARTSTRRTRRIVAAAAIIGLVGFAGSTLVGAARSSTATDLAAVDRPVVDQRVVDRTTEPLRLACEVRQTDEQSGVVCRWSAPTSDQAAGVRLLRIQVGAGQGREVVYRSSNLEVTEFVDAPVRPGHRYVYAVQALNPAGRIVGASRSVTVNVPPIEPPAIEALRLNCRAADSHASTDRIHIGCEWSLPHTGSAQTLTLWRSVDGAAREVVASYSQPFDTTYRDVVPAATEKVVYAVVATDGSGEIVAQSRPGTVIVRPHDVAGPDVAQPDVAQPDVAQPDVARPDVAQPDVARPDVARLDVATSDMAPTDVGDTPGVAPDSVATPGDRRDRAAVEVRRRDTSRVDAEAPSTEPGFSGPERSDVVRMERAD